MKLIFYSIKFKKNITNIKLPLRNLRKKEK